MQLFVYNIFHIVIDDALLVARELTAILETVMLCSGKQFPCSECDFNAVSKTYLLRHMEQHTEFKVKVTASLYIFIMYVACHSILLNTLFISFISFKYSQ